MESLKKFALWTESERSNPAFRIGATVFLIISVWKFLITSDAFLGIISFLAAVVLYGYSKSKSGPDKSDKGES